MGPAELQDLQMAPRAEGVTGPGSLSSAVASPRALQEKPSLGEGLTSGFHLELGGLFSSDTPSEVGKVSQCFVGDRELGTGPGSSVWWHWVCSAGGHGASHPAGAITACLQRASSPFLPAGPWTLGMKGHHWASSSWLSHQLAVVGVKPSNCKLSVLQLPGEKEREFSHAEQCLKVNREAPVA